MDRKPTRLPMRPIFFPALLSPATVVALALAATPALRAERVAGRISLRGEVQNAAKPGSISFTYSGQLTGAATGDKINVTGGGLFRSTTDAIVDTTFQGDLTSYRRYPTTMTQSGKLQKIVLEDLRVVVSRRFVRFGRTRVTLERALDPDKTDIQRIRGRGVMRFTR